MPLYGWFFLLLVLAAVGVWAARQRRPKLPAHAPPPPDPDALGSLGLSAPRPASARPADRDEARFTDDPGPVSRPSASVARPASTDRVDADGVSAVRTATRRPAGATVADDAPWSGEAVPLLLASLAAHAGGRVAVVRHDGDRHQVIARSDRGVLVPVAGSALALDEPADLRADDLGALSAIVGEDARAVPLDDGRVLLVERGDASADRYADLLAALTEMPAPADAPTPLARDDAPGPISDEQVETLRPVPRAEIIAQEQQGALDADRPLAFALVTLADAEVRLTQHTPEAVARAESDLRDRLETAPDVRRVEPFGDLLFGAFLDLAPADAADWCGTLASGEPPLFIGAVAPADGDPGAIRDAAAQALRDAYDQQRARVVEV
ncbi:hypothetical protein [Rubrivirga sp. IMCC43871]|uniref:hypothetical protein n=1 Tax=Rubrivirga sp. IMCC43871 TaxID=3391575 RepID=UPI00398FF96D